MELDNNQLQKIKQIELSMLREVDRICRKLNIKYFLLGGTLLGAVRHQGFIPWDDDIDIGLKRSDYEMFISSAPYMLPSYYFLQNIFSDPECMINYSNVRDSRTTFIETSTKNKRMNHGVFIDIFPLDYCPDSEKERENLSRKRRLVSRRLYSEYTFDDRQKTSPLRECILKSISTILKIKFPKAIDALIYNDKLLKQYQDGQYIANYCGAWGKKEIVPADWYAEGTKAQFEGLEVILPKEYDKWLSQVYGNYMELPPVQNRVSHHYTEVVDLETPYTDYCDLIRKN